jgi:hypothetical protein
MRASKLACTVAESASFSFCTSTVLTSRVISPSRPAICELNADVASTVWAPPAAVSSVSETNSGAGSGEPSGSASAAVTGLRRGLPAIEWTAATLMIAELLAREILYKGTQQKTNCTD